jgi:hypothetical protein
VLSPINNCLLDFQPFLIIYQGTSNGKKNKATGHNLKGSRKLQFDFSGGFVTRFGTGGGSVTGSGEAKNLNATGISRVPLEAVTSPVVVVHPPTSSPPSVPLMEVVEEERLVLNLDPHSP